MVFFITWGEFLRKLLCVFIVYSEVFYLKKIKEIGFLMIWPMYCTFSHTELSGQKTDSKVCKWKLRDFLNQSEMNHQHFYWSLSQYSLILFNHWRFEESFEICSEQNKDSTFIEAHRNPRRPFIIMIFLCDFIGNFYKMLKSSLFQKEKSKITIFSSYFCIYLLHISFKC